MTQPLTALCTECDYMTDIRFKVRPHPNTVEETYFECEHCNHHFTCFVTDYDIRAMQRRKDKLLGYEHTNDRLAMQDAINERMAVLKQRLASDRHEEV